MAFREFICCYRVVPRIYVSVVAAQWRRSEHRRKITAIISIIEFKKSHLNILVEDYALLFSSAVASLAQPWLIVQLCIFNKGRWFGRTQARRKTLWWKSSNWIMSLNRSLLSQFQHHLVLPLFTISSNPSWSEKLFISGKDQKTFLLPHNFLHHHENVCIKIGLWCGVGYSSKGLRSEIPLKHIQVKYPRVDSRPHTHTHTRAYDPRKNKTYWEGTTFLFASIVKRKTEFFLVWAFKFSSLKPEMSFTKKEKRNLN